MKVRNHTQPIGQSNQSGRRLCLRTLLAVWAPVVGYPVALGLLLILAWELAVIFWEIPQFLLPAPSAIAATMVRTFNTLLFHTGWTLLETLLGFVIGTVFAFICGVGITYSRFMQNAIYPVLVVVNTIPKIALA